MKTATLLRVESDTKQTLGYFFGFDGAKKIFEAVSLELDQERNERNKSRVVANTYKCSKRFSKKYGWHYILENTMNRDLVLIHVLNYYTQTQGCIGVGRMFADINKDGKKDITSSRDTLDEMLKVMGNEFYLTIVDLDY